MGINGEALQLDTVYKKPYFYYKSHENLSVLLKKLRESVSSHMLASECAMKVKVHMIKS